jgi:AcrR family transcriptional regulator
MGVAERRARTKEALRQNILSAALEIMAAEGYEALSIRRIAEKIDYAPSTIYVHFKDKLEIVTTICAETLDKLTEDLKRITAHYVDPVEGLRNGLRCYIDFGIAHPSHYLVSFCQPLPVMPLNHPTKSFEAGLRCFAVLQNAVRECIDSGRIRSLDINLLSESIWVSVHGLTSLMITHSADPHFPWVDRELLIENTLTMILRGSLTNPEELPST